MCAVRKSPLLLREEKLSLWAVWLLGGTGRSDKLDAARAGASCAALQSKLACLTAPPLTSILHFKFLLCCCFCCNYAFHQFSALIKRLFSVSVSVFFFHRNAFNHTLIKTIKKKKIFFINYLLLSILQQEIHWIIGMNEVQNSISCAKKFSCNPPPKALGFYFEGIIIYFPV